MAYVRPTLLLVVVGSHYFTKLLIWGGLPYQASNGKDALEIIKINKVDLVISDIRMPNGDGVELLCNIKDQNVCKPIVILMSGFTETSVKDLYQMGADAYFSKPFEASHILKTVQELILKKSV